MRRLQCCIEVHPMLLAGPFHSQPCLRTPARKELYAEGSMPMVDIERSARGYALGVQQMLCWGRLQQHTGQDLKMALGLLIRPHDAERGEECAICSCSKGGDDRMVRPLAWCQAVGVLWVQNEVVPAVVDGETAALRHNACKPSVLHGHFVPSTTILKLAYSARNLVSSIMLWHHRITEGQLVSRLEPPHCPISLLP